MVRIKMPLRLIEGEKHRNTTFMKRRVVIKKKAMELGKLCDIVTLLVCFGPRGQLEVWPEDRQEARRIIEHYRSLRPDECITRRYDLATFFEAHLKKLQAELARERNSWLDGPPAGSLEELAQSLEVKLAAIEERISHLRLVEQSRGKEVDVWGQHQQSQPQEDTSPPLAAGGLPLDAIFDVQPIQSFEGIDRLPRVKPEKLRGKGLQSHAHAAAAAAAVWKIPHHLQQRSEAPCSSSVAHSTPDHPYAPHLTAGGLVPLEAAILDVGRPIQCSQGIDFSRVKLEDFRGELLQGHAAVAWEAPCDHQTSEMLYALPHSTADHFTFPLSPDHNSFSMDMMSSYLDDPSPFLAMDLSAHAACTSSSAAIDVLNLTTTTTTTTLPLQSFCREAPFGYGYGYGYGYGGRSSDTGTSRGQPAADSGYCGFSLHHLPPGNPVVTCNDVYHQNELRGGDHFFHGGRTAGASGLDQAWPAPIFHDLPPTGRSNSSVQAVPPGGDDSSKFMPTSAKNPYA